MGGGATWYRITLLSGQREVGSYKLEEYFVSAGSELPQTPPYEERLAITTLVGLSDAMGRDTFDKLRHLILALSQPGTTLEHRPFPRYFAP